MAQEIRRVVVGPDGDGGVAVRRDGPAPAQVELPAVPGTTLTDLWRSDEVPLPPPGDDDPTEAEFALMPPGALFRVIDLGPTGDAEPMWHRTASVDCIYIATGTATLLHEGGEVDVAAGDTVVVGGVTHAWVNRGDGPCRLVNTSIALAG